MEELARKASIFFKDKPVKKAYVFGSTARGEQDQGSDIDILVDLDYENGADFFAFLDMRDQLSELLQVSVDLVSSNGLSPYIKLYIDQEKKLIYEKL